MVQIPNSTSNAAAAGADLSASESDVYVPPDLAILMATAMALGVSPFITPMNIF